MNNVLLSLETSPLFQSINEGSSYQDFIYKLQDGIGSLSKHRMEIPFNSIKSNTTATFDLPEYGLVHRLYIRLTVRNHIADPANLHGNSLLLDTAYFANIFSRISLLSHSREIEQLTPLSLINYVLSQPATKKAALKKLVDYSPNPIGGEPTAYEFQAGITQTAITNAGADNVALTSVIMDYIHRYVSRIDNVGYPDTDPLETPLPEYRYVYVPLPFNFFNGNGFRSIKDLQFLEKLSISCHFGSLFDGDTLKRPSVETTNPVSTTQYNGADCNPEILQNNTQDADGITILGSCLVVDYLQLPNEQLRQYEQQQFKMEGGKPLSMLSGNVATETTTRSNQITLIADKEQMIYKDIPINCKNVCYKTLIAVKDTAKGASDFEPISKIELWLSGRKVQEYNTMEELRLENLFELGQTTSRPSGVGKHFGQYPKQHKYNQGCNSSTDIVLAGTRKITETEPTGTNVPFADNNRFAPHYIEHYENVYTLNHGIEKNPLDRNGGCISFKGVSSPFLRIHHIVPQGAADGVKKTYEYFVEHAHFAINSISGADGSVSVSLSL